MTPNVILRPPHTHTYMSLQKHMYTCTCTPRHRVQRTVVQEYNKDMYVLINPKEDFPQKSAAFIGSKGS